MFFKDKSGIALRDGGEAMSDRPEGLIETGKFCERRSTTRGILICEGLEGWSNGGLKRRDPGWEDYSG